MQTQVRSLASNAVLQMVTMGIIIVNGLFHLAFGAAYADAKSPFSLVSLASLFQSDVGVKSVAAYMIISGILLMLVPIILYWNLFKNPKNKQIAMISWALCCILVLFNFTSAILVSQIYTPTAQYNRSIGTSFSVYETKVKNMYNFALADAVITFILGWPSSLYLVLACNYQRSRVQGQNGDNNRDKEREDSVSQEQREPGSPHSPQHNRNSPPRSIDLERDHQYTGQAQRKLGSLMYKEFGNHLNQQGSHVQADPSLPRFNAVQSQQQPNKMKIDPLPPQMVMPPQPDRLERDDYKRSKTQFTHSQPDFDADKPGGSPQLHAENKSQISRSRNSQRF